VVGILFSTLFGFPENAYATCVNYIQSQTIAAAYEGDAVPTVHTMDTCGGDDTSYQIPIATTINFDGIEYSNIYATTNSVITFGQPDGTYWDYPQTPSISLYSMDWVSGWYNAPDTLNISYSEGGFQLSLQVIPFGQWNTPEASNINILVAITNTGGISVAYSYQGPEYPNLRTGVRLHDGSIVSLEACGATQISAAEPLPTLQAEPIPEPTPTPIEPPATPEEIQAEVAEATQLASEISDLNNLIASINGEEIVEVTPEPEVTPDPEPTEEPSNEPDVIVEPEIIDPEDPRFPDSTDGQNEQDPSTNPEDSGTIDEPSENQEPSPEPVPQEEDTNQSEDNQSESLQPSEDPVVVPDNNSSDNNSIGSSISEDELNKLNKLISQNDAKLLAQLTDSQKEVVADSLGVKANEILLIAELAQSNPTVAKALESFAEKAKENADAPMPYTLADAITEENMEAFLNNPIGALTNIDLEKILSPSEWGKDMTDDQREKVQEVVIPVILVGNIVSSVMSLRRL